MTITHQEQRIISCKQKKGWLTMNMNWENDGEDEVLLGEDCEDERKK